MQASGRFGCRRLRRARTARRPRFQKILLVGVEVASVQVVLPPPQIIGVLNFEIAKAQARLRPLHVVLRAMDLREHESLVEGLQEQFPLASVAPQVLHVFRAGVVSALGVAHAPVVNGFQLPEVAYQDDRDVPERVFVGVDGRFAEATPLGLL